MPSEPIIPARLARSARGTPCSAAYGDLYHAEAGGLQQARHVFLGGNGLPGRWRHRASFTILETGFGLGLNFLETWRAFRDDADAPQRLHFVSVEKHPLHAAELAQVHDQWPEVATLGRALRAAWPPLVAGFHRLHFDGDRVTLTLVFGDAGAALPQIEAQADALYLDGFAPSRNPELWTPQVCNELARLAAPGATLATWCVAGVVRERLAQAGFAIRKLPGFARKREMLAGAKAGKLTPRVRERHAAVIGAGLAGTAVAERLASRGWSVEIFERHAHAAQEASGNPSGVLQPALNLADAPNARFSRAAFLYGLRHLLALPAVNWGQCGVLRVARDAEQAARLRAILQLAHLPAALAQFVDAGEAAALAGCAVRGAGVWFPQGAWANPASVCEAAIARHGERVAARFGARIAAPGPDDFPLVVDATGTLLAPHGLPLASVRGQVTYLPAARLRRLDIAVTGEGYIAPSPRGGHCTGATFDHDDPCRTLRRADHAANIARVEAMLPGFSQGLDLDHLDGRVGHRIGTPDRLPVFGELRDGWAVATGLGARGLVWAPLAAEVFVSALEGEPLPVERELAQAIAPQRFLRRTALG